MKQFFRTLLVSLLCLSILAPTAVFAAPEDSFVTQTSMVRALQTMLTTEAPLQSEYTQKSPYGGKTGNLGFAQTLFYRLFLTKLPEDGLLSEAKALTVMSHFEAGDAAQASTISAARGALRFGDLIQYGRGGHISAVLGEVDGAIVVYDCGFGGDKTERLRLVEEEELTEQALKEGDEGGLFFLRSKNLPTSDITLNLVAKPKNLTYYLEADPNPSGALLEYYSAQTGKQEIPADSAELKCFASTAEAGKVPMLFLYGSAIAFCTLEVKDETVENLKIEKEPAKLEYTTEEEVDMTGAVIVAEMKDGTKRTLEDGEYTVSYAFTAAGSAEVTVSYSSKTAKFSVKVKNPPVTRLSVIAPTKTRYYVGERLDLTGASLVVDYEKEKNVTVPILESMLSAYDTTRPGEVEITVTYGEKTTVFVIEVVENKVAGLRLITQLNKQYRKGSSLDLAKIELTVLYEDAQSRTVTAQDCEVKINGQVTSTFESAGEAEIVFTYQGISTGTVAVNVAEDPMTGLITAAIVTGGCLIGVPLIILLLVFLARRRKERLAEKLAPAAADYLDEHAEEVVAFEEEDEEELRYFEEKANRGDTVRLPKIATGVPSIRSAGEEDTMRIPSLSADGSAPAKPDGDTMGQTRKIDFFDEL